MKRRSPYDQGPYCYAGAGYANRIGWGAVVVALYLPIFSAVTSSSGG